MSYGSSYARTLAEWHRRFDAAWPTIGDIGFDERFRRMWQYYLSYCEGGFRSRRTDVSQVVLGTPRGADRTQAAPTGRGQLDGVVEPHRRRGASGSRPVARTMVVPERLDQRSSVEVGTQVTNPHHDEDKTRRQDGTETIIG